MSENGISDSDVFAPSKLKEALEPLIDEKLTEKALEHFYSLFLKTKLLVPRKEQERDLAGETLYPSPFIDLIGITSDDKVYVPIFLTEEDISDWYPDDLNLNEIDGEELCKRMPEGWWITLNPGSEEGKEFSPWEITHLKHGEDGLRDVILEQLSNFDEPVQFRALTDDEVEKTTTKLSALIERFQKITNIYGGIRVSESSETLVFGVIVSESLDDETQKNLESELQRAFIGDIEFELHTGTSLENDATLSLFRFSKPIYTKNSDSAIGKIFSAASKFFRT